jgi:hypothetical protein
MQIELTPQVVVGAIGVGLALQTAIVTVAILIRGTARDLARESAAREETEKANDARFLSVERDVHRHDVALRAIEVRTDAVERTATSTAATVAAHAQTLAALTAARSGDRPRAR